MVYTQLPSQPWIVWWSGDIAIYVSDKPIVKFGKLFKRIWFIPTEYLLDRYGIREEDLNYEISEWGVLFKDYPAEHIEVLSQSPNNPVVLVTCRFDGTEVVDHLLTSWKNRLAAMNQRLQTASEENAKLREDLKIALERVGVLERAREGVRP